MQSTCRMTNILCCTVAALFFSSGVSAQTGDLPLGIVTASDGAKVRRKGSNLPLSAPAGEFIFSGDVIISDAGAATVAFCPEKASLVLPSGGEYTVSSTGIRATKGALGEKKALIACQLPAIDREPSANLSTYGSTMTRGGTPARAPQSTLEQRINNLPEPQRSELKAALEPINHALNVAPDDVAGLVTRATLYLKYGLDIDALDEFRKVSNQFGAERLRGLVHKLDAAVPGDQPHEAAGKTYALLVGISHYEKIEKPQWLAYADQDATTFAEFLRSPRGGSVDADKIQLLINEGATTAAIRNGIHQFLNGAQKNDTVILLIAAHGVVDDKTSQAYIVSYDSDPGDLYSTAVSMSEIQALMNDRLTQVGRALVYVDVCRAGTIGSIKSNNVNKAVEQVLRSRGQLLGFMASRSTEYSWEGPNWGGGHGAFTYFVLRGLAGEADKNDDGIVDVNELIEYVRARVMQSTRDEQHPVENVTIRNAVELADIEKPGITLSAWLPISKGQSRGRSLLAQALPPPQTKREKAKEQDVADFEEAIDAGRIVPETPGSAYNMLHDRLEQKLTKEQYRIAENELRVALENHGQQVILRYLDGDQVPQTRDNFASGALYFDAARLLTPESSMLESKELFCRGRILIFDKRYADAVSILERAARIDAKGAYSLNALGIAYLEQAEYELAIEAFRDAIRLAPYWAYPLHNLALTYTQLGDYGAAVRTYRKAMDLAPQYAYLPYNLGLLYQRVNKRKEAESAYRSALKLAPDLAEPYNALGYLRAAQGRAHEAEDLYNTALQKNPNLLAARQNLAVMLSRQRGREDEAVGLWRLNISKQPKYLPSRLSLAKALSAMGRPDEALNEYKAVIAERPDYVGARLALADLYEEKQDLEDAFSELQRALEVQPSNPVALERLGDLEAKRGQPSEALDAYQKALVNAIDGSLRKRLRSKIKMLHQ